MERWGKPEGKRLVIYLIFMFTKCPLSLMSKLQVTEESGRKRKFQWCLERVGHTSKASV